MATGLIDVIAACPAASRGPALPGPDGQRHRAVQAAARSPGRGTDGQEILTRGPGHQAARRRRRRRDRVDVDELGPGVLAAQVGVTSPAGTHQVTADPASALALAAALEVPVRVADALMDRLAVAVTGDDQLGPFTRRTPARPVGPDGPRAEPQNLAFADGLNGWITRGSSRNEVTGAHWDDYTVTAADGTATLAATVPHPYGDVSLSHHRQPGLGQLRPHRARTRQRRTSRVRPHRPRADRAAQRDTHFRRLTTA
jgi:hypothetical protein